MSDEPGRVVTFRVTNSSKREIDLVLEPLGEVYVLAAGASRNVLFSVDAAPALTIDVNADEIKIWEESTGQLEIEPDVP